jgi:two-component system response regulator YesN
MYRALIVEDEDLMREYLATKLTKICPDWEAAATASDGIEAVEILAHDRFDAVLTDIRMPGMNGLELARYIRRTDPELPILILSGYNEFEYARTSMRLNVFDYLLKPINEEELSAALSAIAVQAEARYGKASDQLLSAALSGNQEASNALAKNANGKVYGLIVLAPSLIMKPCERNIALDRLKTITQASVSPLCTRLSRVLVLLLESGDPLLVETDCHDKIQWFLEHHPDLRMHFGYTSFDCDAPNTALAVAQEELDLALALNEPVLPHPPLYAHQQVKLKLVSMKHELQKALSAGTITDDAYASLHGLLREFDPKIKATALMSLMDDCETDGALKSAILEQICAHDGPKDAQVFSFALKHLFSKGRSVGKQVSVLVRQALDYLQLHFSEPISLSFLAEQLCITPAYLSTLFHHEMGLSYSQYLLKLRMEDASRRLLSNPNVKIHEVGESVGFPSSKHFTHVFGQYFHMTPKEYRESKGQ